MKTEVQLTEKTITIKDLMDSDHVGFITAFNGKGHITQVRNHKYLGVYLNGSVRDGDFNTVQSALIGDSGLSALQSVYKFDTRKELYQWLAE